MASRNAASSSASYSARAPLTALTAGTATPAFHGAMLHRAEHGGRLRPGSREHPCRLRLLESDEAAKCPGGRGLPGRRTRGEYRPGLGSEVVVMARRKAASSTVSYRWNAPSLAFALGTGIPAFAARHLALLNALAGSDQLGGSQPAAIACLSVIRPGAGDAGRFQSAISAPLIPVPLPVSTVLRPGTPRTGRRARSSVRMPLPCRASRFGMSLSPRCASQHGDGYVDPAAPPAVQQRAVQVALAGALVRLLGQDRAEPQHAVRPEAVDAADPAARTRLVRPIRDRLPGFI